MNETIGMSDLMQGRDELHAQVARLTGKLRYAERRIVVLEEEITEWSEEAAELREPMNTEEEAVSSVFDNVLPDIRSGFLKTREELEEHVRLEVEHHVEYASEALFILAYTHRDIHAFHSYLGNLGGQCLESARYIVREAVLSRLSDEGYADDDGNPCLPEDEE